METLAPARQAEQTQCAASCKNEYAVSPAAPRHRPVFLFLKRAFDIAAALCAGIILLLPLGIIALAIKLDSQGPVIFKQERLGKNGKPFTMYKFRSMRIGAPSEVATRDFVDSDRYITRLGSFLRRTSLDELPQLWNILTGSMSFVGYRPVCLTEVELNELRRRYGVFTAKPGLTGLAQVSGRDNITFEEKAALDAQYVRNQGLRMDLWCLAKTVIVVFTGEGAI